MAFRVLTTVLRAVVQGLEHSFNSQSTNQAGSSSSGGYSSALLLLEILHTHYCQTGFATSATSGAAGGGGGIPLPAIKQASESAGASAPNVRSGSVSPSSERAGTPVAIGKRASLSPSEPENKDVGGNLVATVGICSCFSLRFIACCF